MSQESVGHQEVYRQGLSASVASVCIENGCDMVRKSALETLTEMLQSYLTEVARNTRQYCEIGGRSQPTLCDLQAALADAGFKFSNLADFILRSRRVSVAEPTKSTPTQNPSVLLVGERRNFPTHVPESSEYPKFPDPHTYIRTLTGKDPEENYGILRERGSSQRWDVERALTKFIAKTGTNHPLLPDDKNAFPLIAAVPPAITYQSALLSCDNELGESSQNKHGSETWQDSNTGSERNSQSKGSANPKRSADEAKSSERLVENIDNPFLRPPKMPRLKKRKR